MLSLWVYPNSWADVLALLTSFFFHFTYFCILLHILFIHPFHILLNSTNNSLFHSAGFVSHSVKYVSHTVVFVFHSVKQRICCGISRFILCG